ncbi:MAG: DUF6497 family protein [Pseudomonadota bacterium]
MEIVHYRAAFTRTYWSAGSAAPPGRNLTAQALGGWGCILTLLTPSIASAFELPSGHDIRFQDSFYERQDDGALWARFRFVMPAIGAGVGYDAVAGDFLTLCETYALPSLAGQDIPEQIVISLAAQETEFGVSTPGVVQFFEAFRPESTSCMWEAF